jgi:hypothetical protein
MKSLYQLNTLICGDNQMVNICVYLRNQRETKKTGVLGKGLIFQKVNVITENISIR